MVGMLSIPFITPTGVSALRFRRISGNGNKYHQEGASYTPLFNVRDFHRSEPYIALDEGEFDTSIMSGLVGVPAVGLPGCGQWNKNGKYYKRLFQDYDKVFVLMDPHDKDDKGQQTAKAICRTLPNAVNIVLPEDVNDTYLLHGREFILKEMGLWEELSETQPSVLLAA
jgi:5S rRNA maturation endonuclease (ribonuclease M5)